MDGASIKDVLLTWGLLFIHLFLDSGVDVVAGFHLQRRLEQGRTLLLPFVEYRKADLLSMRTTFEHRIGRRKSFVLREAHETPWFSEEQHYEDVRIILLCGYENESRAVGEQLRRG